MIQRVLALAAASTLLGSVALAGGEGWQADFDVAAKMAKEQGKDLLVDFTGSDWCRWCIQLDDEVFSHESFLAYAKEHYVLTALDYPNSAEAKAKVPNEDRNEELKAKYKIRGFPTVLLMTPDGEVFGQTGYQPGGPEAYVKHLTELKSSGKAALKTAKELVAKFKDADGATKATLLDDVVKAMQATDGPIADLYVPLVKQAMSMDADGTMGLRMKAITALVEAGHIDKEVSDAALAADPKNEQGLFQKVVVARMNGVASIDDVKVAAELIDQLVALGEISDKNLAKELYLNAAFWNHQFLERPEVAAKYAALAQPLLSDDDVQLKDMLQTILDA